MDDDMFAHSPPSSFLRLFLTTPRYELQFLDITGSYWLIIQSISSVGLEKTGLELKST